MEPMKDFIVWMIQTVPGVLLEPPISAFTAILLLYWTAGLVQRMIHTR